MNHLSTEFAPRPDLKYPFNKGWNPEPGKPFEVAEGVFWVRVPMPIALDHINLWLLKDGDGWVIVDSGLDDQSCKDVWEIVFDSFLKPELVNKIIITHFHPDHIGLAAWLAGKCDCKIWITEGEFWHYHEIVTRDSEMHAHEVDAFISELGFNRKNIGMYLSFYKMDDKPKESRVQPEQCVFIKEGDELIIGDHTWRIVMGNGHSPEHACLYCPQIETLIAGDQALPRISSNISVYIINKHKDPLGDWLDSCAKLRDEISSDTLILPSHQEPFYGLDLRMQQLIDDHHAQLNRLRLRAAEPTTTDQARRVLFDRELSDFEVLMATGEALSHINYLWHRGELEKTQRDDKVLSYQIVNNR